MAYDPPRITVLRPPVPPIEDEESKAWPPPDYLGDLGSLPPHVRRAMQRAGIGVGLATPEDIERVKHMHEHAGTAASGRGVSAYYDPEKRRLMLRDNRPVDLFPGRTPTSDRTPRTSVDYHEAGHAWDYELRRTRADLSVNARRFQNICRKYQAGTPGGGGGMGEFVDQYFQDCEELYAHLWGAYQYDKENLRRNDPQAYDFMREVDAEIRARGTAKTQKVFPPLMPPESR